jgi:prophage regulatory protein
MSNRPIRLLRLPQVMDVTGLGKTKIYELQAEGSFPTRTKITSHSVAWIEEEVQAWHDIPRPNFPTHYSPKCGKPDLRPYNPILY